MFGFGTLKIDEQIISSLSQMLVGLSLSQVDATAAIRNIVNELKADMKKYNADPYKTNRGDELISDRKYMEPRLNAGLTENDVKAHWNKVILFVYAERKFREMLNFMHVHVAEQQGRDVVAAGQEWKINNPRYGMSPDFDPADPYHKGMKKNDGPLFHEFATRISNWHSKTVQSVVDSLVLKHGTYNAMVRYLVAEGAL